MGPGGGPPGPPRPGPPGPRPRPPPPPPRRGCEAPSWLDECLGIMAGLGRGIPGTPPAGRGAGAPRPAGGRGAGRSPEPPCAPPPGRGARRVVPMPWVDEKGLLPGRGCPPRRGGAGLLPPGRPPVAPGRAPGRGPGRGPGLAAESPRAAGGWGRGTGPGLAVGFGFGAVSGSPVAAGVAGSAPGPPGRCGARGAAGFGPGLGTAGFFAPALRAVSAFGLSAPPTFSRRRRTTGASIVDEADLTNSPMSLRIFRTSLLSSPNSLASS